MMIEYNRKDESVGFIKDYEIYLDDITGEMITDDYYYLVNDLMLSEETLLQLHEEEVAVDDDYVEYCYMLDGEIYAEDKKDKFLENFKKVVIN